MTLTPIQRNVRCVPQINNGEWERGEGGTGTGTGKGEREGVSGMVLIITPMEVWGSSRDIEFNVGVSIPVII